MTDDINKSLDNIAGLTLKQQVIKGQLPQSWYCVDCGCNTAPNCPNRSETEAAWANGIYPQMQFGPECEIYEVYDDIWKQTGLEPYNGCLCIGCLESRIGRELTPDDFRRNHPFNNMKCSERLLKRRKKTKFIG